MVSRSENFQWYYKRQDLKSRIQNYIIWERAKSKKSKFHSTYFGDKKSS